MQYRTMFIVLATASLALAGCGGSFNTSIELENENPLVASRYGDELADAAANLIIQNDPIMKEPGMQEQINKEIVRGKQIGQDARERMSMGMQGAIIPLNDNVAGTALYLDDVLYFSSDFYCRPGVTVHVYLTTVVDPRDGTFPDATAIDLGPLQYNFGAQRYAVPHQSKPELMRSLAIYDKTLKRLYALSQLSKQ